jgi:hypothetical protein
MRLVKTILSTILLLGVLALPLLADTKLPLPNAAGGYVCDPSFVLHGPANKVRLGAAYLLRPSVADQAKVVWIYPFRDGKIAQTFMEGKLKGSIYVKLKDSEKFTVYMGFDEDLAKKETFKKLMNSAQDMGIEMGLALNSPTQEGIKSEKAIINWNAFKEAVPLSGKIIAENPTALLRQGCI